MSSQVLARPLSTSSHVLCCFRSCWLFEWLELEGEYTMHALIFQRCRPSHNRDCFGADFNIYCLQGDVCFGPQHSGSAVSRIKLAELNLNTLRKGKSSIRVPVEGPPMTEPVFTQCGSSFADSTRNRCFKTKFTCFLFLINLSSIFPLGTTFSSAYWL